MKKLIIFIGVVCCVWHLSVFGAASLPDAIGGEYDCNDLSAVRNILKTNPRAALSKSDGKSMLQLSILACCFEDGQKDRVSKKRCGRNEQGEIAKLLIENGADLNEVLEYPRPGGFGSTTGTPLDLVRDVKAHNTLCVSENTQKNLNQGINFIKDRECKKIENLLIKHEAKTYEELKSGGEASAQPPVSTGNTSSSGDRKEVDSGIKTTVSKKDCPVGATGIYPNCNCGDGKDYKNDRCVSKCNEQIANRKDGVCVCKETGKTYNADMQDVSKSTCVCPKETPVYDVSKRQCVTSEPENGNTKKSTKKENKTKTLTVRGTVYDNVSKEPLPFANIAVATDDKCENMLKKRVGVTGVTSDGNGSFSLSDVPSDAYVCFSYTGYTKHIEQVSSVGESVYLDKHKQNLPEVEITGGSIKDGDDCGPIPEQNIIKGTMKKFAGVDCPDAKRVGDDVTQRVCWKCVPTMCDKNYVIKDVNNVKQCVKCDTTNFAYENATDVKIDNGNCVINNCGTNYVLNNNVCTECTIDNFFKDVEHVKTVVVENNRCVISECDKNYNVVMGKCVEQEETEPKSEPTCNLKESDIIKTIDNEKCEITKCADGYDVSADKKTCISKCNEDVAKWDGSACTCKDIEKTYNEQNNTCECPSNKPDDGNGNCVAPKQCPDDATGQYPKCRCTDTDKKYDRNKNECVIDELKKAYEDAKAKEQSLENRMLTATTVAATGIGGMELARGFSEQQADKNARNDMLGYVSTFRCEYGKGNNVMGGPDEIQLPVIDLTANKTKYKELAASIKVRKEALGMKPGLESEEILEKTTLYDEENTGITGSSLDEGSIYRAEILGIASDQEKIKSSSEASERRVKGGATSLGGGIVGGITGNSAINGKIGEKIKEIKDKKSDKK